ncbi:MAG: hypothetical protein QM606_10095 [Leucobacter sp.]
MCSPVGVGDDRVVDVTRQSGFDVVESRWLSMSSRSETFEPRPAIFLPIRSRSAGGPAGRPRLVWHTGGMSDEAKMYEKIFAGRAIAGDLQSLIDFDREHRSEYYADGFEFISDGRRGLATWSEDPEFLDALVPFALANGSGSIYAFWAIEEDLSQCPIVVFGDEGGYHVVAGDLRDFLALLSYDIEITVDFDEAYFYKDDDDEESGGAEAYAGWLGETFGIEPISDPDPIVEGAREQHQESFVKRVGGFLSE